MDFIIRYYNFILKWIISWGGAKKIQGFISIFFFDPQLEPSEWNDRQIRLVALFMWGVVTIFFLIGLFNPDMRIPLYKVLRLGS